MKLPLTITALLLITVSLRAAPQQFESAETAATLIELFTSEGCSSCPPAEAWVNRLKASPDLWKRIVPVVYHVDYWNNLGWTDRFATAENSARQRRYAAAWRSEAVYTPGFVLNGREWRGWSPSDTVPDPLPTKVGRLTVTVAGGRADVVFAPVAAASKSLQVELALLGGDAESDVTRGENRGRKLRHDFTVLSHAKSPLRADGNRLVATVPLPATNADPPAAISAWITSGDAQPPLQATGGWLRQP